MAEHEAIGPDYQGTAAGQYSADEHLRAQQEQLGSQTGKPLHEPSEVENPDPAGDHDDPSAKDPGPGTPVGGDQPGGKPLG